jgi:large subunit ribosomal protein L18
MINKKNSNVARIKRHQRVRKNISGTAERPRLNVYRSLNHIYAQIIDDTKGITLVSASSLDKDFNGYGGNIEGAKAVGNMVAKKALEKGSEQSMIVVTTHSPYVMSVVNVLLAAAIVEEKNLPQSVVCKDCIISSKSISGYYIDEKGIFQNIMDNEIPMLSGNDLDGVSDWVDDSISKLNEILFA